MKRRLKSILLFAVLLAFLVFGIRFILKGLQESRKYYERDDKYVTVEAKVKTVDKHGFGYTVGADYEYDGMSSGTYIEKVFGIAPKEGDVIQIEVDSVYPVRVRPSSNGIFKMVFGVILIFAIVFLLVVWKRCQTGKLSLRISPKVKKVIKIIAAFILVWAVLNGIIILITSYTDSKDSEWGLKMSVTDVSSKQITVHLEREDLEHMDSLTYGSNWVLEKRTLFGWKTLYPPHGYVSTAVGYELKNIDSTYIEINFEGWFDELPPGIYRVWKDMFVDGLYTYPKEERDELKQELYATFAVLW